MKRERWKWRPSLAIAVAGALLLVDFVFFSVNSLKIAEGGWFPLIGVAPIETRVSMSRKGSRVMPPQFRLIGFVLALTLANAASFPSSAQLYDNVTILGHLSCETNVDIRTQVGAGHRLRCTFTVAGNQPDILRRYFGVVLSLEAGNPSATAKALSWTVLRLKDPARPMTRSEPHILGSYSHTSPDVSVKYGLNSDTLIGGADKDIALEPRSIGAKNGAYAVTLFGLSN